MHLINIGFKNAKIFLKIEIEEQVLKFRITYGFYILFYTKCIKSLAEIPSEGMECILMKYTYVYATRLHCNYYTYE